MCAKLNANRQNMSDFRKEFRFSQDKACYFDFFSFIGNKMRITLAPFEMDALETRLDRLGMAFIEFNEFNEFCMLYGINWGEPLIENDLEKILDDKLNLSYRDYTVTDKDYF